MRGSAHARRSLGAWAGLAVAALLAGFLLSSPADAQSTDPGAIGDLAVGSRLYALDCASCHAANGLGTEVGNSGRLAPPLRDSPQVTAAYVDLVLRTGRMPPAGNPFDNQPRDVAYTDAERLAIVAYVIAEFGVENNLFSVGEGDPSRGQQLWAANCAACHGATGAGGVAGGGAWTPAVVSLAPTTIGEAIRVGPFQMPAFDEEQISDQGMADIAAFMTAVEEEEGTPLGLTELNPVYASGFAALVVVVMVLSLLWISGKPTWFPDPEAESSDTAAGDEQSQTTGSPKPTAQEPTAPDVTAGEAHRGDEQ